MSTRRRRVEMTVGVRTSGLACCVAAECAHFMTDVRPTYIINIKIVSLLLLFIREKNYSPIAPPTRTALWNSGVFLAITILKNNLINNPEYCGGGKNIVCVKIKFFTKHETNLLSLIRAMKNDTN